MPDGRETAIMDRLRSQHSDLRQGVYYNPSEDPDWDATAIAAAEIARLQARLDAIAEIADAPVNDFETPLRRLDMILRLAVHSGGSTDV